MALPASGFSSDVQTGEAPILITFTDESTGIPITRFRDFGDGFHSIEQNPTHTYYKTGAYSPSLFVSNRDGIDELVKTNYLDIFETTPGQTNIVNQELGRAGDQSFPPYDTQEFITKEDERTVIPGTKEPR